MYNILAGMRVIEASSFVAAPSCALHLAQLGADVIRIDPIGGGPDFRRWPRSGELSLYWEGLQKSKRSIALNLREKEGRELATAIITAPGDDAGLFVTNFPREGFLSHERLAARRPDLITVRVQGWADGRSGLDYTINAVTGYPLNTGPLDHQGPVNHVMPGWDLLTGGLSAMHLLAAERHRRATGQGQEIAMPLSSVAIMALGALGQLAEVEVLDEERPRIGNSVFGAFGRNFATRDGRQVMIVAVTGKQWESVLDALQIREPVRAIEAARGLDFASDEGLRFEHRDALDPIVEAAVARLDHATVADLFEQHQVCWGPYQTLRETMDTHPEFQAGHPMMASIAHPSGHTYRAPGSPAQYSGVAREPVRAAPRLGENSAEVLATLLGLSQAAIGDLLSRGIVADGETASRRA
ncbi:MAG: CoA transferase [Burkholderiaceae bacterium]